KAGPSHQRAPMARLPFEAGVLRSVGSLEGRFASRSGGKWSQCNPTCGPYDQWTDHAASGSRQTARASLKSLKTKPRTCNESADRRPPAELAVQNLSKPRSAGRGAA